MFELTICPVCAGKLQKIREDWVGEFAGRQYIVPDLTYYVCDECGEIVYPRDAMRKIEAYSPAYELLKATAV